MHPNCKLPGLPASIYHLRLLTAHTPLHIRSVIHVMFKQLVERTARYDELLLAKQRELNALAAQSKEHATALEKQLYDTNQQLQAATAKAAQQSRSIVTLNIRLAGHTQEVSVSTA